MTGLLPFVQRKSRVDDVKYQMYGHEGRGGVPGSQGQRPRNERKEKGAPRVFLQSPDQTAKAPAAAVVASPSSGGRKERRRR